MIEPTECWINNAPPLQVELGYVPPLYPPLANLSHFKVKVMACPSPSAFTRKCLFEEVLVDAGAVIVVSVFLPVKLNDSEIEMVSERVQSSSR